MQQTTELWTEEEGKMSLPYSDTEAWERLLMYQLIEERGAFNGPPGTLEKMKALLKATGVDIMRERMQNDENIHGFGDHWTGRSVSSPGRGGSTE